MLRVHPERRTAPSVAVFIAIVVGMLGFPVATARADTQPHDVTQLRAAVSAWGMWLGSLETVGPFADPLPLVDVQPGEALDLAAALDTTVTDPMADPSTVMADINALAAFLNDATRNDITVGDTHVDLGASEVVNSGGTIGLKVTVDVTRDLDAPVTLTDADASTVGPFTLSTPSPGAPSLTLTLSTAATFRVTAAPAAAPPAWIIASGASKPSIALGAKLGTDGTYDFPANAPGAIGVGDVKIGSGSSITLNASWAGAIDDPDGNGTVAFFEAASDPALPPTPGELTLDPAQMTTWDRSGSAAASAAITSDIVQLTGPVALAVAATDLGNDAAVPVTNVTGATADIDELANFGRILPFDLLNGLTQYATLLRGAQKSPNADFELPVVGGRSSDLLDLGRDLSAFIDARITPLEPGSGGNPGDPDGAIPFSLDFSTVGGLLSRLDAETWYTGDTTLSGPTGVSYDEATDELVIDIKGSRALPGTYSGLTVLTDTGVGPAPKENPTLHTDFGSELQPETGMRSVQHDAATDPAREVKTAYTFAMPLVVELGAPCTTGDCALDDQDTQGVVEFQDPMPFERFSVDTGAAGSVEATLITLGKAPLTGRGQIGFVPMLLAAGSTYTFGQDGTNPTTTINLDGAAAGIGRVARIGTVLKKIADQGASDPVQPATRKGKTDATLKVQAHGADPTAPLTTSPGTVTISTTKLVPPYGSDVTLDATAQTLKRLDFDTDEPSAMLGRFLDIADDVADSVSSLPGGDALVETDIPFVGSSAKDLLAGLVDLKTGFDAVRTGPSPVTLADLELAIERELDLGPAELKWELRDVTGDGNGDLIARLEVNESATTDLPLKLSLGSVGQLTADGAQATTTADLDLGIVIPLDGTLPAGAPRVLKTGGFTVTAAVDDGSGNPDTNLQVEGNLGPFGVRLGDSANNTGAVHFGAKLDVLRGTPDANASESITDFITNLDVTAGGIGANPLQCSPPDPNTPENPPDAPPPVSGTLGCVNVPVFVNGALLSGNAANEPKPEDYLSVQVNSLTDFTATPPSGLEAFLDAKPLNFESFEDGFASILKILDLAVKMSTFGSELPLVGDDLAAGAQMIAKLQAFLENPFAFITGDPSAGTVGSFLVDGGSSARKQMADLLIPMGILRDADYAAPIVGHAAEYDPADTDVDYMDIRLVPMCGGAVCALSDPMTSVSSVTFELELGQGARDTVAGACATGNGTPCGGSTEIPLDLGIDGLPLGIDAKLQANAGWTVELGFGVSRDDGFFLLDNPTPGTGVPDGAGGADTSNDEIRVGASVELKQGAGAGDPEATGTIGFIEMNAEDKSDRGTASAGDDDITISNAGLLATLGLDSGGTCTAEVGVATPNCSNRITLGSLINDGVLGAVQTPVVTANVNVDLELTTGLEVGDSPVADLLPTFKVDFVFDWVLTNAETGSFGAPTIQFNDVRINVKALFDNALGKLLKQIDDAVEPLDPVREVAFSPIPVISDLSRMFGGGDVTMVDLAELFGNVNLGLLEDINRVLDYIELIANIAESGDIPLGSFGFDGNTAVAGAPPTPDQVSVTSPTPSAEAGGGIMDEMKSKMAASGGDTATAASKLGDLTSGANNEDDFRFELFENPTCAFGLLLGKDCSIFEWTPDVLSIDFEYEQSFGPFFGVLYVTLGGSLSAHANLGVGFSTRGIRLLGEDLISGTGTTFGGITERFFQSIYLTDLDPSGTDIDEISVSAEITAGGKVSVVIAEAGVRGGLRATVAMNWHDGPTPPSQVGELDGKLYIDEVLAKIATPLCLMDLSGRLEAFLEVYAQLGVCPFCVEESFELAKIVLLEFSSECEVEPPNLADPIDGEVVLNVGTRAEHRNIAEGEKNESFVVRQLSGPDSGGNYKFSINAFGIQEEETGKRVRVLDASDGDDSFVFQGVKNGAKEGDAVNTGSTDNAAAAPFTADVKINTMGPDNDNAKTGDGVDEVHGGAGNDTMILGSGVDYGFGDGDSDAIFGDEGADELRGGDGDDSIDGGLGADQILGDDGHDQLSGGSDQDGPPAKVDGADNIRGGNGNDTITGGSGDDFLYGEITMTDDADGGDDTDPNSPTDAGADRISGEDGADTVYGGGGKDLIIGGFADASQGNDTSGDHLHGNGADDEIYGRAGDDDIWGGDGADRLYGEEGNDDVHGQGGNDPDVRGGPGDDDLWGGGGADAIFGEAGDDDIVGDGDGAAEADLGTDTIDGGTESDHVVGDNGSISDPGSEGGSDRTASPSQTVGVKDVLRGGDDGDFLYGEGGPDELYGGLGDDLIHGNGGNDFAYGESNADEIWGDGDDDVLDGGPHADLVFGNAGTDTVYGQAGNDDIFGGTNADGSSDVGDLLYGNAGEDRIYGDNDTMTGSGAARVVTVLHDQDASEFGGDTIDGGAGQDEGHGQDGIDHLYGGTEHDQLFGELGGDFLYGQDGPDALFGDKGSTGQTARAVTVPDAGWQAGTPKGSPAWASAFAALLVDESQGGADVIEGGTGDDHGYGGAADDTLRGGAADDHLEGNAGQDKIYGHTENSTAADGQDDIIGGSSTVSPSADPPGDADSTGSPDTGELEIQGNGAADVITGDNANQTRQANEAGTAWLVDPVTNGHLRTVVLFDTEEPVADLAAVSGDDLMAGNDGRDRVYGEGGNDLGKGNDGQDLLEGNQGRDWMEGNADADDIIGGSSIGAQPDDGDQLHGGGGPDVILGDNACIVRDVTGVTFAPASCPGGPDGATDFTYETYQLGIQPKRGILLRDLTAFNDGASGPDVLSGGEGVDVEFGQDEADKVQGGPGDDYQQGNGAGDTLVGDSVPDQLVGLVPASVALAGKQSEEPELSGPAAADGQDDQLGGSNIVGFRDAGDTVYGDGEADFQLGDNGQLTRTIVNDAYAVYEERYPDEEPPANAVIERNAERYDVTTDATGTYFGADTLYGGDGVDEMLSIGAGDGDDSQWGQNGGDTLYGEDDDDDQYGELGDDFLWGGDGEDAMLGDRGGIVGRYVDGVDGAGYGTDPDPAAGSFDVDSPPGIEWTAWVAHPLDRRVSLSHERYTSPSSTALPLNGMTHGGSDQMRGGPGHDSMHGAFGNDYMNGDSGGDYLFGADGADVMWGGRGKPDNSPQPQRDDMGTDREFIDILFGGFGSSNKEAGADILDYQPRVGTDPELWFTMTEDYEGFGARQHHHGTDWIYGGWDRDVLQGDVAANGPNDGDKLLDWTGAYNLYTHCNAAYGGWNDVRKPDPAHIDALERLMWSTGAGTSVADARNKATSGGEELALVYPNTDNKANSGKAFSATPGHFEQFICTGD